MFYTGYNRDVKTSSCARSN